MMRNLSQSRALEFLLMAAGVSFFASLIWAAELSPRSYDWRYQVISSLASPRDNPHANRIAQVGLAVTGLVLIFFNQMLRQRFGSGVRRLLNFATGFFSIGAVLLMLTGLIVPGPFYNWSDRHLHEHLAEASGVFFGLGTVLYLACLLKDESIRLGQRTKTLAMILVIVPTSALLLSRFTMLVAYLMASGPDYEALRKSLWCSLALWEWIGAVSIYGFLWLMVGALARRA